jgi:5-methyltetrahydropteroyltriglutamate--homocysteine methyltransferase
MRRSADAILATHTGSLPRPAELGRLIAGREAGQQADTTEFGQQVSRAVANVVASHLAAGVSVVTRAQAASVSFPGHQ